ncbi:MAG: aminoacyl-tRNA hydrolase [Candidatus Riflebacteria bacterium]|nr:aminoacyl-tRNA hydrolase [Candidatus Riflebacteria bacterium]
MLIAGLGNPGDEYRETRHNIGFKALDALAKRFNCSFEKGRHKTLFSVFHFKGEKHMLVKPMTFMNLSGDAIIPLIGETEVSPSQLIVVVDDINLPIGRWRLRSSGGHGGHNGLKSIIGGIGEGFWRLRIGVGMPECDSGSLANYVLGPLTSAEKEIIERQLKDLSEMACMILAGMGQKAMGRFNGKDYSPSPEPSPGQPEGVVLKKV